MKRLSDAQFQLAEARLLGMGARTDVVEIEVDDLDLALAVRAPLPSEYAAWIPNMRGEQRSSALFVLIANCLVYPCDAKAEPDLAALTEALDALPGISDDLFDAINSMACGEPVEIFDLTPATKPRATSALGEKLESLGASLKIVSLPPGAPARGFAVKKPSRISYDAFMSDATLGTLCERAEGIAHDCIVGLDDKTRNAVMRWAPGLVLAVANEACVLAGSRKRDPRKKVRRGSSATSAPMPNTPESA